MLEKRHLKRSFLSPPRSINSVRVQNIDLHNEVPEIDGMERPCCCIHLVAIFLFPRLSFFGVFLFSAYREPSLFLTRLFSTFSFSGAQKSSKSQQQPQPPTNMSNEYSFSLTTFSPNGKLVQIEHALAAVNSQGRPALGIKAKNGVVIATEKKTANSILIDDMSVRKVEMIDEHIGCVYSGMPADYRVILARARKEAKAYWQKFQVVIPVRQLVRQVATVVQEFTQSGGVRPFGVSLLICGYDLDAKFQLFQVDPSGAYFGWKATALVRGDERVVIICYSFTHAFC